MEVGITCMFTYNNDNNTLTTWLISNFYHLRLNTFSVPVSLLQKMLNYSSSTWVKMPFALVFLLKYIIKENRENKPVIFFFVFFSFNLLEL